MSQKRISGWLKRKICFMSIFQWCCVNLDRADQVIQEVGHIRMTYNQVSIPNGTLCADRVSLYYINATTCGTRPEGRSRPEDIWPPQQELHTELGISCCTILQLKPFNASDLWLNLWQFVCKDQDTKPRPQIMSRSFRTVSFSTNN